MLSMFPSQGADSDDEDEAGSLPPVQEKTGKEKAKDILKDIFKLPADPQFELKSQLLSGKTHQKISFFLWSNH